MQNIALNYVRGKLILNIQSKSAQSVEKNINQ
jgi:hypothetical protein